MSRWRLPVGHPKCANFGSRTQISQIGVATKCEVVAAGLSQEKLVQHFWDGCHEENILQIYWAECRQEGNMCRNIVLGLGSQQISCSTCGNSQKRHNKGGRKGNIVQQLRWVGASETHCAWTIKEQKRGHGHQTTAQSAHDDRSWSWGNRRTTLPSLQLGRLSQKPAQSASWPRSRGRSLS